MLLDKGNAELNVDQYSPLRQVNRSFDLQLNGEEIRDSKGKKFGKVLGSQYNVGTALIDVTKLKEDMSNETYHLSDYRILIWQPAWLELEISKDEDDSEEMKEARKSEQERQLNYDPTEKPEGFENINIPKTK